MSEAAARCRVSANALRYYERVGLVDRVERDGGGRRVYDEHSIAQALFVTRMRATGVSIRSLREYMDLVRAGDHTAGRRREILEQHRARLRRQREEIDACLRIVDRKLGDESRLAARTPARRVT